MVFFVNETFPHCIKDICIIYYASVIEVSLYWWPPWFVCIKSWNFVAGTLKIVPE